MVSESTHSVLTKEINHAAYGPKVSAADVGAAGYGSTFLNVTVQASQEGVFVKRILGLTLGCFAVAFCQCSNQAPIPKDGLQLWLKADAGVTLDGAAVSTWADQSGNGNDAIQPDAPRRPLLVPDGLNGLPVLRFDGTDDRLALTGTAVMSQLTLFIVVKIDSGATGPNPNYPVTLGDLDATGKVFVLGKVNQPSPHTGPDFLLLLTGPGVGVRATAPNCAAFGRWNSISVTANQTMWNTSLRANGADASITRYEPNMLLSVSLGSPGGRGVGGLGGSDGIPLPPGRAVAKCDIAEVIVYSTVLPDSMRRSVETYLEAKYNLQQAEKER